MHSMHIDPDTGVKLELSSDAQFARTASISVREDDEITLRELRELVARCADMSEDATVTATQIDPKSSAPVRRSITALHVRHRVTNLIVCPGGDACVCHDQDGADR